MSDVLKFKMGEFESCFPVDRQYARNHMWATISAGPTIRFGFTAYAVRLMQDVYFLDWTVDAGSDLTERDNIGGIESKKAEADLFAPITGRLLRFNQSLLDDPSTINLDNYGEGWLFEIAGSPTTLLSPAEYLQHLASVWEVTQRTLKAQSNE